jgi:alanyl-tRNA synthetase
MDKEYLKSIGLDDDSLAEKVQQAWTENVGGLEKKRDELLGTVNKYKSEMEQYQAMQSEYEQLKKRLEEQEKEKMTEEERVELAKQEAAKEWQEKYSEAEKQLQSFAEKERQRVRNESVFRSVGDKGDAELILDVIAQRNLVETLDKDGEYVLKVRSLDGQKELESVDQLVEEMKSSDKYGRLFNSSGLSGGGSKNSANGGAANNQGLFGAQKIRAAREK